MASVKDEFDTFRGVILKTALFRSKSVRVRNGGIAAFSVNSNMNGC